MRTGQLNVHSGNILPIIKKWLYSEKDIFIRELASNSADAIQKLSILQMKNEAPKTDEMRIDIRQDKEKKTLTFSDTGIGLTEDEAVKYLAEIAFSGAEEFMKAYELHDTFIGHFGLGFFSAFMVADRVEVISRSYKEGATPIVFHSDGSSSYTVEKGTREKVGTDVVLHLNPTQDEYLNEVRLKEALIRFCAFFPYPLYLNEERINTIEPLWLKNPSECEEKDYKTFFHALYPLEGDPLFWVHINVDYPFHVKGILYFPRIHKELDLSKDHVKLFCNRVFVSDDCRDILPDYLTILKGALDSEDIPLNVSRSHLQVDRTVKQLAQHISKKVADALLQLFKNDRTRYESSWEAYETVIKLGLLQDEKFFQKAKELLIWKTTKNSFLTTEEMMIKEDDKALITYCHPGQEHSPLVEAFSSKNMPVAVVTSSLDHPLMSKLEKENHLSFKRIDATLDKHLLDPTKEKTVLDVDGKTESVKIGEFFKKALSKDALHVEAKSLYSASLPSILTFDETSRRLRDYMRNFAKHQVNQHASQLEGFQPKTTLIINTNSPLIQKIYHAKEENHELASQMAHHVFELAKLSHQEFSHEELHAFVEKEVTLLEKLAEKALL